jgi:transposase
MPIPTRTSSMQTIQRHRQGGRHGQAVGARGTLGIGRADSSQTSVCSRDGQASHFRSYLSHRHPLRSQDRYSLGGFPAGDGRLRHDSLEPAGRVAAGRRLGPAASHSARQTSWSGSNRFLKGHCRLFFRPCDPRRQKKGPSPVDRRKSGFKLHLVVDAAGVPLAVTLTGANRHDVMQLLPLIDAIPPIAGKVGAPLSKPRMILADRAYDSDPHRMQLSARGIATLIARRNTMHRSGLGVSRYVVEQTIALLHPFRRLRTRFDRRDDIHESFMSLGCAMICWRRLHSSSVTFLEALSKKRNVPNVGT